MFRRSVFLSCFSFLTLFALCGQAQALETIITNPAKSDNDKRFEYPLEILRVAMERTEGRYGPFEIRRFERSMSRKRALRELVAGGMTVFSTPTRLEWEAAAIPIRIPIRKGLLGYKLLLVRGSDQHKFSSVENAEDLKRFRFGGGQQWSSSLVMNRLGFKVHGGPEYEPLFAMLDGNRFDYFPRGVNEIFQEYDARKEAFPSMVIEGNLAIYLPLPTYFFVSPLKPKLAKRVKEGLLSMVDDGTLDKMFLQYHEEALKRANLRSRKIIRLKNLNLSDDTPFHRKEFWYYPK